MKKRISNIYRSFGVKLLLLVVAGLVIVTSTNSSLFAAGDERFVSLYIDGKTQNVITDADTVGQVLDELNVGVHDSDTVEPSQDTKLTGVGYQVNVYRSRPVRVVHGGETVELRSASYSPELIAKEAGLKIYPEDEFIMEQVTQLREGGFVGDKVTVDAATSVTLAFDDYKVKLRTQSETVGDLLDEYGLQLKGKDFSIPKTGARLSNDQKVTVVRVDKDVITEEKVIAHETVEEIDYTKPTSFRQVTTQGRDGRVVRSFRLVQRGTNEPEKELISETIIDKARDEVVTVGGAGSLAPTVTGDKKDWLNQSNISSSDHGYADAIVSRESGWRYTAWNAAGSSAYGLCQALPGSKMSSAGADWKTNPVTQLNWCHSYAIGRYGSWAGAHAAWQRQHWW